MAPRAASPALSESAFDISNALFPGDDDVGGNALGDGNELGVDLDIGGDGSDDEAFIAARQAASNRKSSNVKGSVKKGGGFQAVSTTILFHSLTLLY